jgi:dolichyl-phosphate-mannose-protein mannosyltransferase
MSAVPNQHRVADRSVLWSAIAIGVVAEILFACRVTVPHQPVFDEIHYLPAAQMLRSLGSPVNIEHPLFAKALMAVGITVFGDNSLGWRALSTLASTAVVVGIFAILWLGTRQLRAAIVAALLTMLNFTVFIQARIAMLDSFMAAFVVTGAACLLWSFRARDRRAAWWRWIGGAVLLGLATACKWVAAPYVAAAALAFPLLRRRSAGWRAMSRVAAIGGLGLVSIATYFATFTPAFFYHIDPMTPGGLIPFQWRMYLQQTQVLPPHTYQSSWWTWPFDIRPIWYLYEVADGAQRGILMIGNPAILWGGLIAVVACAIAWVRTRSVAGGVAAATWVFSLAIWAIIPKSLGFFYYYYLSSIWLSIAIAVAFTLFPPRRRHWDEAFVALSAMLFVHFYPIIAATALDGPQAFNRWMWFDSWR